MATKPTAAASKTASKTAATKPSPTAGQSTGAVRPMSRTDVARTIAEKCGLTRKQIESVFSATADLIGAQLGRKGPGVFAWNGMIKLKVVRKPATKAKQGINPFTKEVMTVKAKPARNVVKALPLAALKEMV